MKRKGLNIVMNQVFEPVKEENRIYYKNYNDEEATTLDKLSNTYPRTFSTIIGKTACVENALTYLISNNMPLKDMKIPYRKNKSNYSRYLRNTRHIPHYHALELIIITDSILSDKHLVAELLKDEELQDLENINFIPKAFVKSGLIKTLEYYPKRKSYVKSVKKVLWEIRNAFEELEKAYREKEILKEDQGLDPITITNLNTSEYKTFKNYVKEKIAASVEDKKDAEENLLENVRGAEELKVKNLKDLWLL